jgi:hypothetical protein
MAAKDIERSENTNTEASRADNWIDLANHFQVKVQKRTSEVSFLQTKAGFLIAAAVLVLQIIVSLPKFTNPVEIMAQFFAVVLGIAALIVAIISMHIGKSTTPLKPDQMILDLTERPTMTREQFGKWLAKSYAAANKSFNEEYNSKYTQQIIAAIFLVTALTIAIILKGFHNYV